MMISIFCNLAPQNHQFGTKKNCCYCLYCCHKIVATIFVVILKLLLLQCCDKDMSSYEYLLHTSSFQEMFSIRHLQNTNANIFGINY